MKKTNQTRQRQWAFTLVEMLVVISIIGVLAALIFPTFGIVRAKSARKKAHGELKQVEAWIDSYKSKFGVYPPDNPEIPALSPLYYELAGTRLVAGKYETLDGRTNVNPADTSAMFELTTNANAVNGFLNVTRPGGDDSGGGSGKAILSNLRPDQTAVTSRGLILLVSAVGWPVGDTALRARPNIPGNASPILYNSSSPTHNPKSYDLWVYIKVGNKINRISNWNEGYEEIAPTAPLAGF